MIKPYDMTPHYNNLAKMVLMWGQNILYSWRNKKNIRIILINSDINAFSLNSEVSLPHTSVKWVHLSAIHIFWKGYKNCDFHLASRTTKSFHAEDFWKDRFCSQGKNSFL